MKIKSFEYEAIVDYLVKPISFERFLKSINKLESRQQNGAPKIQYQAIDEVSNNDEFVFINVDKTLHKINLNSIMYVQSDRNYVTVVSKELRLSFIDSLKKWTVHLKQDNFLQIHKSFILNINYIDKLTGNLVYINNQKIPVGKTYKEALFNRVKPIN